jgi:hypothetical protein
MNIQISTTGDVSPISQISNEELNQSIESLHKLIIQSELWIQASASFKCFLLKSSYELGYYYYLNNNCEKMKFYFDYCITHYNEIGTGIVNQTNLMKTIYFKKESLIGLLKFIETNKFLIEDFSTEESGEDDDMKIERMEEPAIESIDKKNEHVVTEHTFKAASVREINVNMILEEDDRMISSKNELEETQTQSLTQIQTQHKLELEKDSNIIENDFTNLFNQISLKSQDKAIIDVRIIIYVILFILNSNVLEIFN